MISNQILQNAIDGLKGITRVDLCVCDTEGKVYYSVPKNKRVISRSNKNHEIFLYKTG